MLHLQFFPSVSSLSRADFVSSFGGVYEHSQWIAEAVHDRGLTPRCNSVGSLCHALRDIIEQADYHAQLVLLKCHPDLSGKLAKAGTLTKESREEQASAQLDQCTAEQFALFTKLNSTYTEKFGFPFIIAVRNHNRQEILDIFQQRVNNNPEQEFSEALQQVHTIAQLRLITLAQQQQKETTS